MTESPSTLCAPDQGKSCFACCPPIRPPGYEHLPYANEIKRVLRDNTASLRRGDKSVSPITGFSCWALGYLDGGFKRIGCLLHPSQNEGEDLRYRWIMVASAPGNPAWRPAFSSSLIPRPELIGSAFLKGLTPSPIPAES